MKSSLLLTNAMPWLGLTWDLYLLIAFQCQDLSWTYMTSLLGDSPMPCLGLGLYGSSSHNNSSMPRLVLVLHDNLLDCRCHALAWSYTDFLVSCDRSSILSNSTSIGTFSCLISLISLFNIASKISWN